MNMTNRPYRSALYIPASKPRAMEKARTLPTDAILFDLEDAVAIDAKEAARGLLCEALSEGGFGQRSRIVRINALSTEWGAGDARAITSVRPDAVLLPKVDSPADIDALSEIVEDLPIWAMMETPRAVINAASICSHPRLHGIVMGTNDLAKELRTHASPDRLALMMALQTCVVAARAADIVAIDGVYNAFRDVDGLQSECLQGRMLGFDGKSLIHPAQLDTANEVFAPTEEEVDLARRQIEAYDEAQAAGQGVAVVDGAIVENLHVETARRILAQAVAIGHVTSDTSLSR